MSFKKFPVSRLENLIGDKILKKVEKILPIFDSTLDTDKIYQKNNLIKVLYAFFDSNDFKDNKLRTEFLTYQQENEINLFCNNHSIDTSLDFEIKIERIIQKKWDKIEFCRSFCDHFDIPYQFIPQKSSESSNLEFFSKSSSPFKVLKDYQSSISFRAIDKLTNRNKRFIIQMPTGSGKTRTAMEIIADTFNTSKGNCIIFWLVYSEELCEQAVECFSDIWKHVGKKDVKLIRAWGKNKLLLNDEDDFVFVVGGFQKLTNIFDKQPNILDRIKDKIYLIIVDEAHRVLAPTYKKVTDTLWGKNSRLIGLTATPGRGIDNSIENQELSKYFNEEKLDIITPNEEPVFGYLKKRGIMSYGKYKSLITSPSFSITEKELKYLEDNFDYSPSFIKNIGEDESRNLEIINELITQLKIHKKALFFGCSVEHSKFICSILNYLEIKAAHVDGSTDKGARQSILRKFKDGDIQIICNFGILSTGFDAPLTDLVFISRPTQSIVLYSQMIGRGLRGPAVGGTENCTIITVKDNISGLPGENDIFTYFDNYFEK
jgi:superfamily II DNA or RNA helicase